MNDWLTDRLNEWYPCGEKNSFNIYPTHYHTSLPLHNWNKYYYYYYYYIPEFLLLEDSRFRKRFFDVTTPTSGSEEKSSSAIGIVFWSSCTLPLLLGNNLIGGGGRNSSSSIIDWLIAPNAANAAQWTGFGWFCCCCCVAVCVCVCWMCWIFGCQNSKRLLGAIDVRMLLYDIQKPS